MSKQVAMAVVGVGHFGRYHAEKIAAMPEARLVAVVDRDGSRARKLARQFDADWSDDYRTVLGRVDAASVVVPTSEHFRVARDLLDAGVHVLVEKPITDEVASARALADLARDRGLVLQVGHLVRFTGVVDALRAQIVRPLYIDSVRIAPYKPRGTDVNVILDLMVHDLDLILSFVDSPVLSIDAAGAPVISPSEDIASARIKFANGCIANITASRISLKTERKMRIFQPDTYVTVDFDQGRVRTLKRGKGLSLPGVPNIDSSETTFEETDALARQIAAFVDSVANGKPPVVSGEDGVKALDAAMRVTESLRDHAEFVRHALN